MSELIHQKLEVHEWPLIYPGDTSFFGYVVAVGIFPRGWDEGEILIYADFAYNDSYKRYRLPDDLNLVAKLSDMLWENLKSLAETGNMYGKVHITFTEEEGHILDLP